MKTLTWIAHSALIVAANGAVAQSAFSSPDGGFYIDGYAELSYVNFNSDSDTLARAELNMGILPNAGASSFPIGFSLGIDAFSINDTTETALYPALVFALGSNSLVSVGVPRSVVDYGYIPNTVLAESALLDLEFSQVAGSALAALYLFDDVDVYGLRYDGTFGNTKVGASYHRIDTGGSNADVYSLAFSHEIPSVSSFASLLFFGGVEHIDAGSITPTSYYLGLEGRNDRMGAGIKLVDSEVFTDFRSVEIYGDYAFTDSFSAKASVSSFDASGSDLTLYGVGLEYSFLNNGYVDATVTDGNAGFDTSYEISVGWRF